MKNTSLVRMAYARLLGLRDNIPDQWAHKKYIDELHDIIADLEALGVQLDKFRVPNEAMQELAGGFGIHCEANFLRAKVDGLINLFQVSEDKQKIGFLNRG